MAFDLEKDSFYEPIRHPIRLVLYGPPGIGKTSFAAQAPNPYIICTEKGAEQQRVKRSRILTDYDDVLECISSLYMASQTFETVVLDTADWLEAIITQKVINDYNAKIRSEDKKAKTLNDVNHTSYGGGTVSVQNYFTDVMAGLSGLNDDRQMNVIILAHAFPNGKQINDPDIGQYNKNTMKLNDKIGSYLVEWSDVILYAKNDTYLEGDKKDKTKKAGSAGRCIYTSDDSAHTGKNRYNFPAKIPFLKEGMWGIIDGYINAHFESLQPKEIVSQPIKQQAAQQTGE